MIGSKKSLDCREKNSSVVAFASFGFEFARVMRSFKPVSIINVLSAGGSVERGFTGDEDHRRSLYTMSVLWKSQDLYCSPFENLIG